MNESKKLIQQITEGIQDKKGKNIVIADLSKIGDTICNYLVICQGNSPSQTFRHRRTPKRRMGSDGLFRYTGSCVSTRNERLLQSGKSLGRRQINPNT